MATWFDLPSEVKQLIFQMVSDAESIVYIPKDRRYKVDHRYEAAQHFHDLLLVSKSFITTEEFAFAILGKAVVTFYSYTQLRRLVTEVNPSFKQHIRRIHLSRLFYPDDPGSATDSFEGFSSIATTLSSSMPELRQIYISWDDYCAPLGLFTAPNGTLATPEQHSEMLEFALNRKDPADALDYYQPDMFPDILPSAVASFIGNRTTRSNGSRWSANYESSLAWTRPHSWIRRLVQYAEEANIEVVFNVTLCISSRHVNIENLDAAHIPPGRIRKSHTHSGYCWCNRRAFPWVWHARNGTAYMEMHTEAQMSTKDWTLKVKDHEGREYKFYQQLAYDMLHAKVRASQDWWENLLAGLRYDGRHGPRIMPTYAF
ncbi:hypothetical protein H2198_000247 [Neophaeococcomyces mojaviensis]|uniref:Uncharacterized protein n=1 Tax=Neophaeococcomyces mojaviensis TaxID=3383035 RepID=A0ACC3AKL1_9EURO|nr:hypothetical protein H2198_000247 [Knufia sp. JES_112]